MSENSSSNSGTLSKQKIPLNSSTSSFIPSGKSSNSNIEPYRSPTKRDSMKAGQQATKYKRKEMTYVPKGADVSGFKESSKEQEKSKYKDTSEKDREIYHSQKSPTKNAGGGFKEKTEGMKAEGGGSPKKKKRSKKPVKKFNAEQLMALFNDIQFELCKHLFNPEVFEHKNQILLIDKGEKPETDTAFPKNRNEYHSTYIVPKRGAPGLYKPYTSEETRPQRNYNRPHYKEENETPSWFDDPTPEIKYGEDKEAKAVKQPFLGRDLEKEKERFKNEKRGKTQASQENFSRSNVQGGPPRDLTDIDKLIEELGKNSYSEYDKQLEEKARRKSVQPEDVNAVFDNLSKKIETQTPQDDDEETPLWGEDNTEEIKKNEKAWELSLNQEKKKMKENVKQEDKDKKINPSQIARKKTADDVWGEDILDKLTAQFDKQSVSQAKPIDLEMLLKQSEDHHKKSQAPTAQIPKKEVPTADDSRLLHDLLAQMQQDNPEQLKMDQINASFPSQQIVSAEVFLLFNPFSTGVGLNESDRIWFYKDPNGNLQGPFTGEEMYSWFKQGYFDDELEIAFGEESIFVKLGEFLTIVAKPFLEQQQNDLVQGMNPYAVENIQVALPPEGSYMSEEQVQAFLIHQQKQQLMALQEQYGLNPNDPHDAYILQQLLVQLQQQPQKDAYFDPNSLLENALSQNAAKTRLDNIEEARSLEEIEKQSLSQSSKGNSPKSVGFTPKNLSEALKSKFVQQPQQVYLYQQTGAQNEMLGGYNFQQQQLQQQNMMTGGPVYGEMGYQQFAPNMMVQQPLGYVDPNVYQGMYAQGYQQPIAGGMYFNGGQSPVVGGADPMSPYYGYQQPQQQMTFGSYASGGSGGYMGGQPGGLEANYYYQQPQIPSTNYIESATAGLKGFKKFKLDEPSTGGGGK